MNRTDTNHPDYYHRVVDCQWACPAHTNVPEYIRLIAQGRYSDAYIVNRQSNVFPGILGTDVRSAVRAGVPADPRRRQAGRDLPVEARGRRSQGRRPRSAAEGRGGQERQEGRADRRRPGVADGGQRSDAARLRRHDLREAAAAGRADAHQHPGVPAARRDPRRGDRLHRRHGREGPLRLAGREPRAACSTRRRSTPCSSAAARRRARSSRFPAATTPIRSSSASSGSSRFTSATSTRSASAC